MNLSRSFLCAGCARKRGEPHAKDCRRVIAKERTRKARPYSERALAAFARIK